MTGFQAPQRPIDSTPGSSQIESAQPPSRSTDPAPKGPVAWHTLSGADTLALLNSAEEGLNSSEAQRRLTTDGRNELVETKANGPLHMLWEQLTAVMVLILIGAATLSLFLGKFLEAGAIYAIVVLFVTLGFVQEFRAEKAIAALRRMAVPLVRVQRGGAVCEVPAVDLVVGDIVLLEAGNIVPADLRLVECAGLRIQEAALTGESDPVDKAADPLDEADQPLGDRINMGYSGTQVTNGRGTGIVIATGMDTELGHIASLLQGVGASDTPLQVRLDKVGKQLALGGVVVAGIVVLLGALGGEPLSELFLTAISVAVAVIPEGLPAVVTFTLAIGAQRMLRRNALIRKLPAVETLGSVTVICSDKTGTLTQNKMTVAVIDVHGQSMPIGDHFDSMPTSAVLTLVGGVLCNDGDAQIDSGSADEPSQLVTLGDPTETALLDAADTSGMDVIALRDAVGRIGEYPFDSERKRMSTIHAPLGANAPYALRSLEADRPVAFVKGAVDGMIGRVAALWDGDGPRPCTDDDRERVLAATDRLASQGMRVLGIAYRMMDEDSFENAEVDLTLLGLVGIIDPARPEAGDAVAVCHAAGIRTVMITGDHPLTAAAISADLGIANDTVVVTGHEIEQMTAAELSRAAASTSVFARVSPEHKLRIVEALKEQGEIVAMTGDGVNDAPALKKSDIGVAMGITGTDVSKEAADVVLRDDNFATIVAAVEEGRVIYDNLRRFVKFAVAGNIGKILVMLIWPIPFLLSGETGHANALLPLQLLWLNLMTDGLLGLALGAEPAERGVMQRPPHDPKASIWSGGLGVQSIWVGGLIGAAALAVGMIYNANGWEQWQTMVFTSLAFLQVFQAIGTRSTTASLRSIGLWSNRTMTLIVVGVAFLQIIALYTPLSSFLDVEPLSAVDLLVCIGLGAALLAVLESVKALQRRRAS